MLPREFKIKRDNDFKTVFRRGGYIKKDFIKISFLKNDLEISRFAFVVGLKISKKATIRNKIRRRLEESIRLNLNHIKKGFDIIIFPEPEIINISYKEIERSLIKLLKEIKLIN